MKLPVSSVTVLNDWFGRSRLTSVNRAPERRVERELAVPDAAVAFTVPLMVLASGRMGAADPVLVKIRHQQNARVEARLIPGE